MSEIGTQFSINGWASDQFKIKRFSSFMVHFTMVHLFRSADLYRKLSIQSMYF